MTDALFITIVGMVLVYAFLFLLMWVVRWVGFFVGVQAKSTNDKIAAVIGVALQGGKK